MDTGYISAELDRRLAERGARLLRLSCRNRTPHPGEHLLKPVRRGSHRPAATRQDRRDLANRATGQALNRS
ncbi:hypothetical protein Are01nite_21230 [Actinoplanes regularis]|nr:hypothetical protein Are01nite_21230 [Actinoplanes regularis]